MPILDFANKTHGGLSWSDYCLQALFASDIVGRMIETGREVEGQGQRRRGRPPLTAGEAKRASFNTRLRAGLKNRLETAAQAAGRSLSEEIEFRLERSFEAEDAGQGTLALIWGRRTTSVLLLIGHALQAAHQRAVAAGRKGWLDDPETYEFATGRARQILAAIRPPGEATQAEQDRLGGRLSTWHLLAPADDAIAPLKDLLGEQLIARLGASKALALPPKEESR